MNQRKGKTGADDRSAQDRQVTRALDVGDAKIFGIFEIADKIGNQHESQAGNDDRHRGKPVEPVGQVDRIAEGHDHKRTKHDVEIAQIGNRPLDERQVEFSSGMAR